MAASQKNSCSGITRRTCNSSESSSGPLAACAAVCVGPAAGSRLAPPRSAGESGPGSRDRSGSRDPADGAELGHEGTDKGRAATLEGKPAPRVRLPREKNPKRPVMLHDVYLRLLGV